MALLRSADAAAVTVLVVGQTPPPVHGQSLMIEALLAGRYERVRFLHVRMAFSRDVADVGRLGLRKMGHLFGVVAEIVRVARAERPDVLYYPPAGPELVPVMRDVAILLAVRRLFPKTVLHFMAGGVSELLDRGPAPFVRVLERAYGGADCAIHLSEQAPPDGPRLGAKRTVVVPPGVPDRAPTAADLAARDDGPPRILYVGHLDEGKGVGVLLEAARSLRDRGARFGLDLFGTFTDAAFESWTRAFLAEHALEGIVRVHDRATQVEKWSLYGRASIFCFPSHYRRESTPLVVLEAMQHALAVVATRWRGIPGLVDDGVTGHLVAPGDPGAVAERLERLVRDASLRREMGAAGRARYERHFTLDRWRSGMEVALLEAAGPADRR